MRYLIYTSSYYPVLGGVQTVTGTLCENLVKDGHDVLVITKREPRTLHVKELVNGILVRRFTHLPPHHHFKGLIRLLVAIIHPIWFTFYLWRLQGWVKKFDPDVFNVHFPDSQVEYIRKLRLAPQSKLISSVHGHDILRYYKTKNLQVLSERMQLGQNQERNLEGLKGVLKMSHVITACSEWMADKTLSMFSPNQAPLVKVLPNFVSINRFENQNRQLAPTSSVYLFAFGRFEPHKGFQHLIEAYAHFVQQSPAVLYLAGTGPYEDNLRAVVNKLDLKDSVFFTGRLQPEVIAAYAQNASLVVVPSLREPFGISVLEAVASNRPFIASNVGGIPEAAGNFGTLYDPDISSNQLAKILHQEFGREVDTEERARRKIFLQEHSIQAYMERYYLTLE